ncbi:uncharacterized protein BX663DRAFT_478483 [Cokeromyces recurvatus]|uniref:uncharacterized protein n=1 Tax=Cokeromyces recurvatus TaxID=90255 RepID=UPI0022205C62|nr:uncharacterized protein BX663DRAFT_478483 [Cokeromyces recurvatus]KAI7899531.1 hypothetical protein BX663DRAFT_478483 [Cokeromyces recurvatus]
MDDLLDLNWSTPTSVVKQPIPKEKPKDAFADLLSTPPKPIDISKLSLIEQQKLKQQQNSDSSWLTPAQTTMLNKTSETPKSTSTYTSSPTSSFSETHKPKQPNLSFDNLLDPFGNNVKKQDQSKNTPLNQLRTQQADTPNEQQWDFDLLDTKLTNGTTASVSSIDPFDVDSLIQQSSNSPLSQSIVNENYPEDNPLGILAEPATKLFPKEEETKSLPTSPSLQQNQLFDQVQLDEDEEDAMLAQLIDMGFSLQESKFAIEATLGQDLQSAIDLLVQNSTNTVQRQQCSSKQQTSSNQTERTRRALFETNNKSSSVKQHELNSDVFQPEKIVIQAQELGGILYKNAASYLKAGRDKVTKAVEDWQEQQRTHRLQQMQEEQKRSTKPKWMMNNDDIKLDMSTNTKVERFVDDDDDDLETERKRMEELRRKQQQQQKQQLKKERLLLDDDEQEVYVSPSRRRNPHNIKSISQSPVTTQLSQTTNISQQPSPALTSVNVRTKSVINVSPNIMAQVNEARNLGNEKFKLGQFGEAEEAYSHAISLLPDGHDHLVLLCNNRAVTRLKTGHYKQCIEDCDKAISLAKDNRDEQTVSEGIVIQWRDQILKSLYRKAEALENIEKYREALATYDLLVKYEGTNNLKINQAMSRCRQALNPKKRTQPSPMLQKKDDYMSMFVPSDKATVISSSSTVSSEELGKSKAVAAMRARAAQQEAEDAEKLKKTDEVNARLLAWKAGKEQNLRALLATLDTLLWPGAQWKGAQMSELINPKKCKIIYMKAISKVHPDKLPSNVTVEQRMLASGIFATLNEAWDSFKDQNQL